MRLCAASECTLKELFKLGQTHMFGEYLRKVCDRQNQLKSRIADFIKVDGVVITPSLTSSRGRWEFLHLLKESNVFGEIMVRLSVKVVLNLIAVEGRSVCTTVGM